MLYLTRHESGLRLSFFNQPLLDHEIKQNSVSVREKKPNLLFYYP